MSIRCEIREYNTLKKQMKALEKAPAKVMTSLTNEAKKRVPGWVASEVTKEYGVKKSENIFPKEDGNLSSLGAMMQTVQEEKSSSIRLVSKKFFQRGTKPFLFECKNMDN